MVVRLLVVAGEARREATLAEGGKKMLMKGEGTSYASTTWFNMVQENQVQVISACDTCRKGEVEIRDMRDRYRREGCYVFFRFKQNILRKFVQISIHFHFLSNKIPC
jgi:hypothetical protein